MQAGNGAVDLAALEQEVSNGPAVIIPLKTAMRGSAKYMNMPANPGDIIVVPGGGNVMVTGWVYKPGFFGVGSGLTVLGAVASAGGAMFAANTSEATLIRSDGAGNKVSLPVNLDKIATGEAPDIPVRANDVVDVPYSDLKIGPYVVLQHPDAHAAADLRFLIEQKMTQPSPYFIRRTTAPEESDPADSRVNFFDDDEGRIDFNQYWRTIRKHLSMIVAIFVAVTLLTLIKLLMETPMYTAEATILIKPGTPQIFGNQVSNNNEDSEGQSDDFDTYNKTQYEILKSRSLAESAIRMKGSKRSCRRTQASRASDGSARSSILSRVCLVDHE